MTTGPIRLLIADDHPSMRAGVRAMLELSDAFEVVAESGDSEETIRAATEWQPDVVVMDLRMPGIGGVAATAAIKAHHPEIAILVLTMVEDDDAIFAALKAGASGYLLKESGPAAIARAIQAVASGEHIYGPAIARRMADFFGSARRRDGGVNAFPFLTEREQEVLDLVAQGLDNPTVARVLGISEKTVRNHVSKILQELHVEKRPEAIVVARGGGSRPEAGSRRTIAAIMTDALGFADLHVHQFAHLAFGGRVLWGEPDGDPETSLGNCRRAHGPHGLFDLPGNLSRMVLRLGSARSLLGHRTGGAPDFRGWPRWDDVTHQAVHEACLKRAVDGGLRLIVMVAGNNELLGRLTRGSDYRDMEAVDLQLEAARKFESSIDARCGGPGLGWYRIVSSPEEAGTVLAQGRLAVVLGIEVDKLFGGSADDPPSVDQMVATVERYHALGVRHVFPVHLQDNAFGGTAFEESLHWSRNARPLSRVNPLGSLPVYRMDTERRAGTGLTRRGGHVNRRGLTSLGRELIGACMQRGFMFDLDHASMSARADVIELADTAGYPLVAGHLIPAALAEPNERSEAMLTDAEISAVTRSGGILAPRLRQMDAGPGVRPGSAPAFARAYRHLVDAVDGPGIAFGTDFNGFAGSIRPEADGDAPVRYPFVATVTGRSLDRALLGERSYDVNVDGVAHIGMLPDLVAELESGGMSTAELTPLLTSASGYVEAWARAMAAR